jgi:hypothetical protein
MGFKVDSSFLRFLTMGALGVNRVAEGLKEIGFEPIELERYSASNKIWATKVKRLRLPDLLCVRTGLRAEVRAKSDLRIRMSDAPNNPDRVWDAGLRDEDIVALIACMPGENGPEPADRAVFFTVQSLRESADQSKLGPPKSASEGAERDRTWPAVVPSRPGRVVSASADRLAVSMEGDGNPPRNQTYALNGKHAYVRAGDTFAAEVTVLAGAPRSLANLNLYHRREYHPLEDLRATNPIDRYAAVKALRFRRDLRKDAVPALERLLDTEREIRVRLEAAASAAALGSPKGEEQITDILFDYASSEMSMEAILILNELKTEFAWEKLMLVATDEELMGDERRQAAIWGIGKAGLKSYGELLQFIADAEENVAFHAIAGFGPDTPEAVVEELVGMLIAGDARQSPAASEALRVIDGPVVLRHLVAAIEASPRRSDWALATIGTLSPDMVRARLRGTPLLNRIRPMLLRAPGANWLNNEDAATNLTFLLKQQV